MKKKFWSVSKGDLLLLVPFLLFGIGKVDANRQHDNIVQAVVNSQKTSPTYNVIFLTIDGRDPDAGLMRRFVQSKVLVRQQSQGMPKNDSFGDSWGDYYVDNVTGRKGNLLDIENVRWLWPFRAYVEVNHPGFGEDLTLARGLNGWSVTQRKQGWIA